MENKMPALPLPNSSRTSVTR